jgi:F420 biosynthesis protein FbiB-like protein
MNADRTTPYTDPPNADVADDAAFWSLIRGRRSIRRYQPRPIPRALIECLLEAAIWAPSAQNRQPWRFCVVTDGDAIAALTGRMAEQWRRDLVADGVDPADVEQQVSERRARIAGAAALIVLSVSMEEMDVYPDERRSQAEWTMTVQSAALAGQNLLLAAHHYGLGACWMCAPLFVPDLIRDALALPPTWHPQALITLGYPAEEPTKERADWETRVVWRT